MPLHESILDTIGRTPIVRLHRLNPRHTSVYVKLESANPGGSVKDRLALAIVLDAERRGLLRPGQTIVEATSGNTGVALAMKHKVSVACDPDLCVRSVPGALSQILNNLVINSIVHGFEHLEEGHILIQVHCEGSMLPIDFQDDGCGMSAESLKHLFDPFYTTKRGRGGSGLGANVVYNLVTTKLGGSISVDSEPGQGLHYRLQIPVQVAS